MPAPPCRIQSAYCHTTDRPRLSGPLQQQLSNFLAVYQLVTTSAWQQQQQQQQHFQEKGCDMLSHIPCHKRVDPPPTFVSNFAAAGVKPQRSR